MASLQTLRNRGGVIVAVVIGVALLAFVLGDMLTSGSTIFGSTNMNVGQINGKKITAQEYAAEVNYLTEVQQVSSGEQSSSAEQNVMIQDQAWESMINKYAFRPAVGELGLSTCDAEVASLVTGEYRSPVIAQVFANPQTGVFDKNYMISFVQQVDQDETGRLAIFWNYLKQQVADQAVISKYRSLIDRAAYVTDFEAEYMAGVMGVECDVRFVAARYDAIADSTIVVTEDQIKEFYEQNKGQFVRPLPARTVEYVAFDAVPSAADYAAAEAYVAQLAADFQTTDNVVQFATLNSQEPFDSRFYSEGMLTGDLGAFAYSATTDQVFGPSLVGDQYTLARVSEVRVVPDSVAVSHIVLKADAGATADSLAAALRVRGADFGAAASQYSLDTQSAMRGGELGVLDPQTMPAMFSEPMLAAKQGDIFVVRTPQGIHIMRADRLVGTGRKVQLAVVRYNIEPSEVTRNGMYNEAVAFAGGVGAASGARGIEGFNKMVKDKGLVKRNATIGGNDRAINGLNASRELVRWGYNGEMGDVSDVMEFGDTFVVATISDITPEGVMPLDEVRDRVEMMVRREIKGEQLAAKLAGAASVDAAAVLMGVPVVGGSAIGFQTYMVPEIGYDPAFAGGVTAVSLSSGASASLSSDTSYVANVTALAKPVVGRMGVYKVEVVGRREMPVDPKIERTRLEAEVEQNAFPAAYQELIKMSGVVDQRYKFY